MGVSEGEGEAVQTVSSHYQKQILKCVKGTDLRRGDGRILYLFLVWMLSGFSPSRETFVEPNLRSLPPPFDSLQYLPSTFGGVGV